MLEIKHNESWKLIRLFHSKGEKIEDLAREFKTNRKTVQEIIKAQIPPNSLDRVEKMRFLAGQGLSTTAISYIMGEPRGNIQHYIDRKPNGADSKRAYQLRTRSALAKIRAEHKLDPQVIDGTVGRVQPKIRAAGDRQPVRRNRRSNKGGAR